MSTIKRKFFYYKVFCDGDNFADMLRKVHELEVSERAFTHYNNEIKFEVHDGDNLVVGKVMLWRADGTPVIGVRGSLTTREIELTDEEGVQEASHFVYDPGHQIMAFEYNQFGPRVPLFFKMINELYAENFAPGTEPPEAKWRFIKNGTALDRVSRSRAIKMVEFEITEARLSVDADASGNQLLGDLAQIGQTRTVGLLLKDERGSRRPIFSPSEFFQRFLPRGEESLSEYGKFKTKIINELGGTELIDLFEDKVVVQISALKLGRSRGIDSDDVFEKVSADVRSRIREFV